MAAEAISCSVLWARLRRLDVFPKPCSREGGGGDRRDDQICILATFFLATEQRTNPPNWEQD